MANTTFSGPVRSENGFQSVDKGSTSGAYTTRVVLGKGIGHATGVTVNTTYGDSPAIGEFTQPANTVITNISIVCVTAPVIGTGDIGFEVGSTSSGAQLVAALPDHILDGGTTVVVGNVVDCTLVGTTHSGTTAPVSPQYTGSERTVYCNITNTVNATTAGSFTFIVEYAPVAPLSS
tara:strand:- start:99 stop:629 length:531 start_codon:yes stop_codon:yes gene_type:complete